MTFIMTRHPQRLLGIVLVLGWFFDQLFWGQSLGVNFAIGVALTLLGGLYVATTNDRKPARNSLLLLIPIVIFAGVTFTRQEPLTLFLAFAFTLFSMTVFALTFLGGGWMQYGPIVYLVRFFQLAESVIIFPLKFLARVRQAGAEGGQTIKRMPILPVVRGVLIALPVVACFASMLASADLVFSHKLAEFFGNFNLGKLAEYTIRLCLVIFTAYLLLGTYLHILSRSEDQIIPDDEKKMIRPFIGFTETVIVLGSVIILFLAFVIIQFRYFFGGNVNIGISGFTYSQYARNGFNELVSVGFFSLVMILGFNTAARREGSLQKRVYSGLSISIAALVLIILVSAFQRLVLAIDWHGFSRFRVYPQVFLVWVGILFVAIVLLEVFHRERYFTFAALAAAMGFAVSLSLINVDGTIVRYNVQRAVMGRHFNPSYLATLSLDAVPALADAFEDPTLPTAVHEGIGAALVCQRHTITTDDKLPADWHSFNVYAWRASSALERLQVQLADYHLKTAKPPLRVQTPGNLIINCWDWDSAERNAP